MISIYDIVFFYNDNNNNNVNNYRVSTQLSIVLCIMPAIKIAKNALNVNVFG